MRRFGMKKFFLAVCCCLLAAAAIPQFRASTGVDRQHQGTGSNAKPTNVERGSVLTKKELADRADLIVVGECVGIKSAWVDDGRNLVTLATISVNETLKGEELSAVTVVLPGGMDADRKVPVTMTYPGAPTLAPREQTFLFLSRQTQFAGSYAITGSAQGKLMVETHEVGDGARGSNGPGRREGDRMVRDGGRRVPLSKFKEEIKSHLRQEP
jgi:hypothetical protein